MFSIGGNNSVFQEKYTLIRYGGFYLSSDGLYRDKKFVFL